MTTLVKEPTISTLYVAVRPDFKPRFVDWQAKFNAAIAGFAGFVSLEFLTTPNKQFNWIIVQRFYDSKSAALWKESPQCKQLMLELRNLVVKDGLEEKTEDEASLRNGVTEVIITQVSPQHEKEYRDWTAKIHNIEAKFPGFRGTYIQSPNPGRGTHWITFLQFDTQENLDRWLASKERQKILHESAPLISSLETHRVTSPYAGWFYSIAKTEEIPSVWKQTMLVLLVLFPIVMLQLKYISPLSRDLNPALAMFINCAISVSLIAFPMMPIAIRSLSWWLFPKNQWRRTITIIGTVFIFALYLLEIAIFWNIL